MYVWILVYITHTYTTHTLRERERDVDFKKLFHEIVVSWSEICRTDQPARNQAGVNIAFLKQNYFWKRVFTLMDFQVIG